MKKFCCALLTLMLITYTVVAQKKNDFVIALEQGVSFPIGKFGDKTYTFDPGTLNVKMNGIAKTGYQANISGSYYFQNNIAVVLNAGFSTNNQSKKSIEDFYGGPSSQYQFDTDVSAWQIWRFLGGISIDQAFPSNDKLFIQAKLLAGISKTKAPGYEITGVKGDPNNPPQAFQVKFTGFKLDPAFSWQTNLGVGYWFDGNFYTMVDVNYFDAKPEYNYTVTMPGNPNNGQKASMKYSLSTIGVNAKIGVRF